MMGYAGVPESEMDRLFPVLRNILAAHASRATGSAGV